MKKQFFFLKTGLMVTSSELFCAFRQDQTGVMVLIVKNFLKGAFHEDALVDGSSGVEVPGMGRKIGAVDGKAHCMSGKKGVGNVPQVDFVLSDFPGREELFMLK